MGPLDLLDALRPYNSARLRLWVQELLTHERAVPDCPGSEEQPPHLRLLELCDYHAPALRRAHQLVQERLRNETWRLCGYYTPQIHGGHLGTELLYFARSTHALEAVRPFSTLLATRAFDPSDKQHLNLWLNAHWIVADVLQEWRNIEGWVTRDANGTPRSQGTRAESPTIRLSAIGVWTTYGPPRSFCNLLLAMLRLLPGILPRESASDTQLLRTLTKHVAALYVRTMDEHIRFPSLLPQPFDQADWGDLDVARTYDAWQAFSESCFPNMIISDPEISDLRKAKRAFDSLAHSSGKDANIAA